MEMERKGPEEAHERHDGEEEAGHEFASFIGGFADRSAPPAPRRAARLCVAAAALLGLAGLVGVGLLVAFGLLSAPRPRAPPPPLPPAPRFFPPPCGPPPCVSCRGFSPTTSRQAPQSPSPTVAVVHLRPAAF
jgi:hypothetical protein